MKHTKISDIKMIDIPLIRDVRGNLGVLEGDTVPFDFKRVYYLFDVPTSVYRGAHSHKLQQEFLIALSGSFDVVLDDGRDKKKYLLNSPKQGLYIPPGIWRELENFSSGSVCLVLSSDKFEEDDYIRDYNDFKNNKKQV
ncbi:MAG: WxcM-like domain-containing protein [Flavobacteriaceae bacterium]|nr:FdtA/QdtA family cupin domain-containing protein [Bacteroidia bacterium]MBT8288577.1 FdtA/QdtA family cupin domain-containing protein [Bacteroidia bacterium]NNF76138.1 WxcM-like domain-containing protein [Flavobacteriaceae bacterium]NNK72928.1 WxcM-like domain-containing protein [Flavobacteriaceae bacterium]